MSDISLQPIANAKASLPNGRTEVKSSSVDSKDTRQAVQESEVKRSKEFERVAEVSDKKIEQAVAQLNDYVQNSERKLKFQVDEQSGKTVVQVFDKHSDELIRQIPNEEALALAQKLNLEEPLLLFSAQV